VALEGLSNALGSHGPPFEEIPVPVESWLPNSQPTTEKSPVTPVAASLALLSGSYKLFL
jgi:hypothetical protein